MNTLDVKKSTTDKKAIVTTDEYAVYDWYDHELHRTLKVVNIPLTQGIPPNYVPVRYGFNAGSLTKDLYVCTYCDKKLAKETKLKICVQAVVPAGWESQGPVESVFCQSGTHPGISKSRQDIIKIEDPPHVQPSSDMVNHSIRLYTDGKIRWGIKPDPWTQPPQYRDISDLGAGGHGYFFIAMSMSGFDFETMHVFGIRRHDGKIYHTVWKRSTSLFSQWEEVNSKMEMPNVQFLKLKLERYTQFGLHVIGLVSGYDRSGQNGEKWAGILMSTGEWRKATKWRTPIYM